FSLFRIVASLITAMAAGILVNIISRKDVSQSCGPSPNNTSYETFKDRLKSFFSYIEYELLGSIANTLVIAIIVAGIIGAVIPD
ncbi:unnamed protein product, partial [marine sediment metagenome]